MRVWLDEMIPVEVAKRLRQRGYDVAAVQDQEHRWACGLDDVEQLEAAIRQGRALVSYNVRDFIPISQQWADERRAHSGIVLIHPRTISPNDIGGLIRQLARLLDANPSDDAMMNRVVFLTADDS